MKQILQSCLTVEAEFQNAYCLALSVSEKQITLIDRSEGFSDKLFSSEQIIKKIICANVREIFPKLMK